MRRCHPNWSRSYVVALAIALACAAGCKNQQTAGLTNPFLGPDRVPPPSTRALTPGTAQPYYQGDPLPVMQSGVAPTAAPVATAPPATPAPPAAALATSEPKLNFGPGHESPVGVPTDGGDLRYPLPHPTPPAQSPSAPPATQMAAAPNVSPVQQASYNEPVPNSFVQGPGFTAPVETWRSPEIPPPQPVAVEPQPLAVAMSQAPASPMQPPIAQPMSQTAPAFQPPITPIGAAETASWVQEPITPIQANEPLPQVPDAIPVRMRPVSSPQPEPAVMPSSPRIRMPSQASTSMMPMVGPTGQQAIYYGPAMPQGAVMQTVQVTALPSYGQVAQPTPTLATGPSMAPQGAAPQSAAIASASRDGFRPRGSTQ